MRKKLVVVGGVAGGANAATRARRLSEEAEIVVFERGSFVSFANCGLPYFLGGDITQREKLLLQTPESLWSRFRIQVLVRHEVTAIDRSARTVTVKALDSGAVFSEPYDDLVLATGATPFVPDLPGLDRPGLFTLRDIPDMDRIQQWMSYEDISRAVVCGGGFIGLEMVEQLQRKGLSVTLLEASPQVLPPLDPELVAPIQDTIKAHSVELVLNDPVVGFESPKNTEKVKASVVVTRSGRRFPADLIVFGIGVRPESSLARSAGLDIGKRGGVAVTPELRTSDEHIWAVGDCIEVTQPLTGAIGIVPLAGPANKQGRMVADNIFGAKKTYGGTLGTAIVRVFDLIAACTGANEKTLASLGIAHRSVTLHPMSHASYYPGAQPLTLKVLFSEDDGKLLGAQAVGKDGVDKRIDVIATAIAGGLTVDELSELELCYAPPFGSAKDPVNIAGMAAENIREHRVEQTTWNALSAYPDATLLDVRNPDEVRQGIIPGAIHIPLPELRDRIHEIPRDRTVIVYCQSGQRSYYASRILSEHGFHAMNLSGAYKTWSAAKTLSE